MPDKFEINYIQILAFNHLCSPTKVHLPPPLCPLITCIISNFVSIVFFGKFLASIVSDNKSLHLKFFLIIWSWMLKVIFLPEHISLQSIDRNPFCLCLLHSFTIFIQKRISWLVSTCKQYTLVPPGAICTVCLDMTVNRSLSICRTVGSLRLWFDVSLVIIALLWLGFGLSVVCLEEEMWNWWLLSVHFGFILAVQSLADFFSLYIVLLL